MSIDRVNYHGPHAADFPIEITQGARQKIARVTFRHIAKAFRSKWSGEPAGR